MNSSSKILSENFNVHDLIKTDNFVNSSYYNVK